MAAPTFVSSSNAQNQTGSTFSVTAPASITNGNLLVAIQVTTLSAGPAPVAPSGWTQFATRQGFGTGFYDLVFWYKFASSEPGSYTFNNAGAPAIGPTSSVYITNWSGAGTPNASFGQSVSSSTNAGPGGGSTISDDSIVLIAWAIGSNAGTTFTPNGSLTELGAIGGASNKVDVGYKTQAVAGAISNVNCTLSMSQDFGSIFVAIPPPPPPGDAFFSTPPLAIRCM